MNTLNKLPGQTTAKKIILNSFNQDRIASTYLFYGEDGVGKWPAAMAMAALLNCENRVKGPEGLVIDACGECHTCRQIENLIFAELLLALPVPPHSSDKEYIEQFIDYVRVKREEPYRIITSARQLTIPIDTAREIRKKCSIRPPSGAKRIVLFYQMERMLTQSADSLLKLIEEPPPETVIILTSAVPGNLLPTIQSRSQKVRFGPIPTGDIAEYLITRYGVSQQQAVSAARLGRGSIGKSLGYLKHAEDTDAEIKSKGRSAETTEDTESDISLRQKSFLMFKGLFSKDTSSALETIDNLLRPNDRGDAEKLLAQWQSFLGDIISAKFNGSPDEIINSDFAHDIDGFASKIPDAEAFEQMTSEIRDTLAGIKLNTHIRPAICALAVKLRKALNQSP